MTRFEILVVIFFSFIKSSFSSEWICTRINSNNSYSSNNSISEQCTISVQFTNIQQEKHICIIHTLTIESLPPLSLSPNHTMQTFRIHSCQLSSLGQLPFSLPSSVQLLDLRNNSLSTFILSFPLPSNLQSIYLDYNPNLTRIDFGSQRVQQKLIHLTFRHNKHMQLSSLPKHLIQLDLTDCNLSQSSILSLLVSLTNLTHLSLADNQLKQLPSIDAGLRLEYLNLSNNHLTTIDDQWIHASLRIFDVRYNQIESLEFLNEKLSSVTINHNVELFLNGNPLHCDCWFGSLLNTSSIIINDLHLLQCHSHSIRNLSHQYFLCSYSRHCASDCSCCDFEACDCHAVCPSDCSCSHDVQWSNHIVQCSQTNLTDIHLLLPQTVTELNYESNLFEEIKPFVFVGKTFLQKLNLAKNNLKNLTNETFCAATNLKEINLSYNRGLINIQTRLNQLFSCLKYLQWIILSKDQINDQLQISDGWQIQSNENDDTTLIRLKRIQYKSQSVLLTTSTIRSVLSSLTNRPTRQSSQRSRTISSFHPQELITFSTSTISTFIRHVPFIQQNQTLIIIVFFLLLFVVLFLILLITLTICRRKLRRHLKVELQRQRSHHHYYYHTRLHPPATNVLDNHGLVGTNDSLYEQLPSLSSDSEQPFLYNEKKGNHPNAPVLPPHPPTFRHHLCCHPTNHMLHPSSTNAHEYQYATNMSATTGYSTPTSQQHQCAAILVWANRLLYPSQNPYNHHDCSTHSCQSDLQHLQQHLLSNQQDQTSATNDNKNILRCCTNNETIFLPTTNCRCNIHGQNTDTYIYPHVHR